VFPVMSKGEIDGIFFFIDVNSRRSLVASLEASRSDGCI
jgi:hypothetical protein